MIRGRQTLLAKWSLEWPPWNGWVGLLYIWEVQILKSEGWIDNIELMGPRLKFHLAHVDILASLEEPLAIKVISYNNKWKIYPSRVRYRFTLVNFNPECILGDWRLEQKRVYINKKGVKLWIQIKCSLKTKCKRQKCISDTPRLHTKRNYNLFVFPRLL